MTLAAIEKTQQAHQTLLTVGVDTHLDSHVAVAIDELGRRLDELHFPTTEAGYTKFLKWTEKLGDLERIGIEGAGSFGAGLARYLRERKERRIEVLEVGRPKRRDQHRSGKSDPIDAELAARAVLAGTAIGQTKGGDGPVEMIRVLSLPFNPTYDGQGSRSRVPRAGRGRAHYPVPPCLLVHPSGGAHLS